VKFDQVTPCHFFVSVTEKKKEEVNVVRSLVRLQQQQKQKIVLQQDDKM
jgi:hypothetical protein